jgi:hypothetical protein
MGVLDGDAINGPTCAAGIGRAKVASVDGEAAWQATRASALATRPPAGSVSGARTNRAIPRGLPWPGLTPVKSYADELWATRRVRHERPTRQQPRPYLEVRPERVAELAHNGVTNPVFGQVGNTESNYMCWRPTLFHRLR